MENKKILDPGDLKNIINNTLMDKFFWINKLDINAENDPFSAKVYIDPNFVTLHQIEDLLEFLGDDGDRATCVLCSNNKILPIGDGYGTKEEFHYTLGTNEIKAILSHYYNLSKTKSIDRIFKIHNKIHIFIEDRKHISV